MTPYEHAILSCRDFSHGDHSDYETYLPIHEFLDSTKFHLPNASEHRAILHNGFGIELCERIFGHVVVNKYGNAISVREIARRHIKQDCSRVPTLQDCIQSLADNTYRRKYNKPIYDDLLYLKKNNYSLPEQENSEQ